MGRGADCLERSASGMLDRAMQQSPSESLTPREIAVLDLLRAGLTNKQIGRSIHISEQTVKYHLKNIYGKLGAVGRAHAVAIADQLRDGAADTASVVAEHEVLHAHRALGTLSPLLFMQRTRRLYGQRPALEEQGLTVTYEAFFERCDRAAALMARLGVGHGDRVAVLAPNSGTLLELFYAVPMRGAVLVPLNARYATDDIAGVLAHCEARVLCTTDHYAPALDALRERLPGLTHAVLLDGTRRGWIDYQAEGVAPGPIPAPVTVSDDDPITINYTSGTGAHPKGVVLTHRNAWVNTLGVLLHWPLGPEDRYLWNLPMFHVNGWGFVWTVTAAGAEHVIVPDGVEAEDLPGRIARDRITALCAGRNTLAGLRAIEAPASPPVAAGVRPRVMCAASAPSAGLIERMESRWGWDVTHAYGLSEASPFVTLCDRLPVQGGGVATKARYRLKARQGQVLLTAAELRVVDEEGQDVPADGVSLGEIVVRGPMVMKGYYRDPESTARVLAGGYLHTGDAAVMYPDGAIEIRDRFKDIIISGDDIISSVEIEDVISQHPAVQDVAVIGRSDEVLGERALAYVQLKAGSRTRAAELLAFAAERLSGLRVPAAVELLDRLPRTATGKIQKYRLRAGRVTDPSE